MLDHDSRSGQTPTPSSDQTPRGQLFVTDDGERAAGAEPVGALLRRHRLAAAQSVGSLAGDLCISTHYVLAIENGHIDELPGATYTLGFVRAYAEYFGLDEHEIVARFKQQHYSDEKRKSLRFPSPEANPEIPKGALLLAGALTACVLYAAWHFNAPPGTNGVDLVDPVPEHLTHLLTTNSPPERPKTAEGAAPPKRPPSDRDAVPQSSGDDIQDQRVAPLASANTEMETPKVSAKATPSDVTEHLSGQSAENRTDAVRATGLPGSVSSEPQKQAKAVPPAVGTNRSDKVLLRATAECWVEIRDSDGKLIYAELLQPGETYTVPKDAALTMLVGNAGGLEVYIDGRQLPPLGRAGAILRRVSLDAENLRARTRGG